MSNVITTVLYRIFLSRQLNHGSNGHYLVYQDKIKFKNKLRMVNIKRLVCCVFKRRLSVLRFIFLSCCSSSKEDTQCKTRSSTSLQDIIYIEHKFSSLMLRSIIYFNLRIFFILKLIKGVLFHLANAGWLSMYCS